MVVWQPTAQQDQPPVPLPPSDESTAMLKRNVIFASLVMLVVAGLCTALFVRHRHQQQVTAQRMAVTQAQRSSTETIDNFRPQIVRKSQELYNKGLRGKALAEALKPEENAIEQKSMATIRRNNEILSKDAMSRK